MSDPTEMELRVAKALEEYRALEPQHSDYINAARAAIRAMYNITDEMNNIGSAVIAEIHQRQIRGEEDGPAFLERIPALRLSYRREARESWQAMIDAASPQK